MGKRADNGKAKMKKMKKDKATKQRAKREAKQVANIRRRCQGKK